MENIQGLSLERLDLSYNSYDQQFREHIIENLQGSVLSQSLRELKLRRFDGTINDQLVDFLTDCRKLQFCDLRDVYSAEMQLEILFQNVFQRYLYQSGPDEVVPLEIDLRKDRLVTGRQEINRITGRIAATLRTSHEQHQMNHGGEQAAATYSLEVSYDEQQITLSFNAQIALIVCL